MTAPSEDDRPAEETHHRSPSEELEWIGAEVEARPRLLFWGTIAVAVVVAAALIIYIVVIVTGQP